jgi:hypothetical protein
VPRGAEATLVKTMTSYRPWIAPSDQFFRTTAAVDLGREYQSDRRIEARPHRREELLVRWARSPLGAARLPAPPYPITEIGGPCDPRGLSFISSAGTFHGVRSGWSTGEGHQRNSANREEA